MTRPALRSKQVRAAKAVGSGLTYAEAGAIIGRSKRTVTRWLQDPELRAIAEREGAVPGDIAPVEVLRAALLATKASGQPDWPTRLSAARAVAALPPEEDEPETAQQPTTPSIVVYDLPPDTYPVVHHAASGGDAPVSGADTPPAKQPPESHDYTFCYMQPDGKHDLIGSWSPPRLNQSADGFVKTKIVLTADPAEGEHWRAELAAGRFPIDIENEKER